MKCTLLESKRDSSHTSFKFRWNCDDRLVFLKICLWFISAFLADNGCRVDIENCQKSVGPRAPTRQYVSIKNLVIYIQTFVKLSLKNSYLYQPKISLGHCRNINTSLGNLSLFRGKVINDWQTLAVFQKPSLLTPRNKLKWTLLLLIQI